MSLPLRLSSVLSLSSLSPKHLHTLSRRFHLTTWYPSSARTNMAAAWSAAAARRAAKTAPKLGFATRRSYNVQRRGLASEAEQHGARKVNFWEDPMHPTKWKESHFWLVTLVGGGSLFYGGYKYYEDQNQKDETDRKP